MIEIITNDKKENEKVVGFRVDPKEYNILKQYAQIFSRINRFKTLIQSKIDKKTYNFLQLLLLEIQFLIYSILKRLDFVKEMGRLQNLCKRYVN
jgi:ferritin